MTGALTQAQHREHLRLLNEELSAYFAANREKWRAEARARILRDQACGLEDVVDGYVSLEEIHSWGWQKSRDGFSWVAKAIDG